MEFPKEAPYGTFYRSCLPGESWCRCFQFSQAISVDQTGPCSAVGNVSGYRCVSDCRSRGREFDPGVTVSFFPSQFFPRGKNGPAHSFPGEKTDRSVFSPGERFD